MTKKMWQDVVIVIFEFSTGKCAGSFDIDDRNDLTRQYEKFKDEIPPSM